MRYLGRIARTGTLSPRSDVSAPATLEIECYEHKGGVILASGEVESRASVIGILRGCPDVRFVTDDGHVMKLVLSDGKTAPSGSIAHVVVSGDLPAPLNGSLGWPVPTRVGGKPKQAHASAVLPQA